MAEGESPELIKNRISKTYFTYFSPNNVIRRTPPEEEPDRQHCSSVSTIIDCLAPSFLRQTYSQTEVDDATTWTISIPIFVVVWQHVPAPRS
jgi:hypothetical protein